jgi:hypothetical protein
MVALLVVYSLAITSLLQRVHRKLVVEDPFRSGVVVAIFVLGLIHGWLGLYDRLGGISALGLLPELFQQAIWIGFVMLGLLLVLAIAVCMVYSLNRWKKWGQGILFMFTQALMLLVIVHARLIGTHFADGPGFFVLYLMLVSYVVALGYWLVLWVWRRSLKRYLRGGIILMVVFGSLLGVYGVAALLHSIDSYPEKHNHSPSGEAGGHNH